MTRCCAELAWSDLSRYQPAGVSDEELMKDFFV